MSVQAPLWRSVAAFRFASLAYAAILLAVRHADYSRVAWAWGVLAGMTAWTVASTQRLARSIHDSVLQVLALVQRRGAEAGGEAAEIGRLAGEQGAALRALIATGAEAVAASGQLDLRTLLTGEASTMVSVVTPADPVLLARETARETAAAVRAALDNVRRHCGEAARAWVLVDDEGAAVTVTIRDDGPGMAPGRLAQAAAGGRLGVSHAIRGRIREPGGTCPLRHRARPGCRHHVNTHAGSRARPAQRRSPWPSRPPPATILHGSQTGTGSA